MAEKTHSFLVRFLKSITLEPTIFFHMVGIREATMSGNESSR